MDLLFLISFVVLFIGVIILGGILLQLKLSAHKKMIYGFIVPLTLTVIFVIALILVNLPLLPEGESVFMTSFDGMISTGLFVFILSWLTIIFALPTDIICLVIFAVKRIKLIRSSREKDDNEIIIL